MSTLIVPEFEASRGTGHLKRCLRLLSAVPGSCLYVPAAGRARFEQFAAQVQASRVVSEIAASQFDKIVVDRFSIGLDEMRTFTSRGTTIGVDLGGPGRAVADYLVDTLPRLDNEQANVYRPAMLVAGDSVVEPQAHRGVVTPSVGSGVEAGRDDTILITFGGEDPARLTEKTVYALREVGVEMDRVRVVRPRLRKLADELHDLARVIEPVETLRSLLTESEWVITAFGLTAYEAASQECRVITVAPTRYHHKLSMKAGFFSAGVGRVTPRRLAWAFSHPVAIGKRSGDLVGQEGGSLERLVTELVQPARRGCPVHGSYGHAVFRNEEKSYFACPTCGMIYLERFRQDSEQYDSSYFMEEYQAQYGRTYLEDFPAIYKMGVERVSRIRRLNPPGKTLLDVGCAYGPFLAAAAAHGFDVAGIDVAEEPVRYVCDKLGFRATVGSILNDSVREELPRSSFGVVSLWYVIEHFAELDSLLSTLADLVVPGGILAISTPHGAGVSARRNRAAFFDASPRDHFTVWTTSSARRILGEYGFRLESVRVTGHHPERYPASRAGMAPRWLLNLHSRVFGWGDTFELYARRVG